MRYADILTERLNQRDALLVMKEIETGRGGIADLVQRRPQLRDESQSHLQQTYGNTLTLYRAVAVIDDLRTDKVVSMTTDFDVAFNMMKNFPVLMGHDKFITNKPHMLRYTVPISNVVAHVPTLIDMAMSNVNHERNIMGRAGKVSLGYLAQEGKKEDEVIVDAGGLKPKAIGFTQDDNGINDMMIFKHMKDGHMNMTGQQMIDFIKGERRNWFPDEEQVKKFDDLGNQVRKFFS